MERLERKAAAFLAYLALRGATAQGWEELLAAQLVREHWFTHDLLYEAVLQHLPAPVGEWLHRRVAEHLSTRKVPAALLAHHWREAGDAARAALFDERSQQEALVVRGA